VFWRQKRDLTYIGIFSLSNAIRSLGYGILYFAFVLGGPVLRIGANALVLLSMMLLSVALSRRYGQRPRYGVLAAIGIVALAALCFYQLVEPSLLARAVIICWAQAALCLPLMVDIAKRPHRAPVEQLFFWLLGLSCLVFFLRPIPFLTPLIAADQIETGFWLIVSITDALICATLGVVIFAIIAADVMDDINAEAQTDALSGLLNRRGFYLRAQSVFARQTVGMPVAAVLSDLDHFKSINDRFGHGNGDRIIQIFSEVLKENAPDEAVIGRQGGEEFVVLLPSGQTGTAHRFAEAVRLAFKERALNVLSSEHSPTASFGIAIAGESDDLSGLMNRADRALYKAKNEGRDCVREVRAVA